MRALLPLLLVATPPLAAERAPVPARATPAQLDAAHDRCKAATPTGDRCLDLQLALARALIASDPARAGDLVKAAGLAISARMTPLEERLDTLRVKADDATITAPERTELARGTELLRRLQLDSADLAELRGDVALATSAPFARETASNYLAAALLREDAGRTDADRRAMLRARGKEAAVYVGNAMASEGLPIVRAAVAAAERYGPADPLVISLSLILADGLAETGQLIQAEALYRAALPRLADAPPAERLDIDARFVRLLALLDRREEAIPLARSVLERRTAAGADPVRLATAYIELATLLGPNEGLPLAERGLALRLERYGEAHVETARARIAVARLFEQTEEFAAAEKLRRQALPNLMTALFTSHAETFTAWLELVDNLMRQNRIDDAARALVPAENGVRSGVGEAHPAYGRVLLFKAMIAFRRQDPQALTILRAALAIIRATLPPAHLQRLQAEGTYAAIQLYGLGDAAAALPPIRDITRAALDRAARHRDYGRAAQAEMRYFSGMFGMHVRAAWQAAQPRR